jgi:ribonuclease P protein component
VSDHGLPRELRLRRSVDFQVANRVGRRVPCADLMVVWRPNGLGAPRLGLAVSRKVGNAVVRNRVKRWLREAMRHERAGLTPVDVVLIARPSAASASATALRSEVATAFARISDGRPR